jgi:hypothetical protein
LGTWQKAFETPIAGDTVYFRAGIWYPITTTMRDAIVDNFEAYMDSNSKGIIP